MHPTIITLPLVFTKEEVNHPQDKRTHLRKNEDSQSRFNMVTSVLLLHVQSGLVWRGGEETHSLSEQCYSYMLLLSHCPMCICHKWGWCCCSTSWIQTLRATSFFPSGQKWEWLLIPQTFSTSERGPLLQGDFSSHLLLPPPPGRVSLVSRLHNPLRWSSSNTNCHAAALQRAVPPCQATHLEQQRRVVAEQGKGQRWGRVTLTHWSCGAKQLRVSAA